VTTHARDLLNDVLALSKPERAKLADALLQSIEDDGDDVGTHDEEWAVEVKKRLSDMKSGAARSVPWADVRRTTGLR
jgi:putative addiction module component (TIGR02574 family)